MSSNAFNELAREYNEREDRLEEIRERLKYEQLVRETKAVHALIRCPNACTEPCDYPTCRCHQGKVSEADLDKAIAGSVVWADTRETEADLRAVVCEACVFVDTGGGFFVDGATITPNTHYMRLDMKEPTPMSHDREPPPRTTWTDYILVALIGIGLYFAWVYWVDAEPAVPFTAPTVFDHSISFGAWTGEVAK